VILPQLAKVCRKVDRDGHGVAEVVLRVGRTIRGLGQDLPRDHHEYI